MLLFEDINNLLKECYHDISCKSSPKPGDEEHLLFKRCLFKRLYSFCNPLK